jgi:hypothetical protein
VLVKLVLVSKPNDIAGAGASAMSFVTFLPFMLEISKIVRNFAADIQ